MPDVDMKVEDKKKSDESKDEKKDEEKKEQKPVPIPAETEIKNNALLIDRAVSTFDSRLTHRVLRTLTTLRKRINAAVLRTAIDFIYVKGDYSSHFDISFSSRLVV
jgi:26S proteasome regulatory subunit N3